MPFQPAMTVKSTLSKIHNRKYLLPAIQREFVWKPDQIRSLVDSLMRGYPIGSLLLWDVDPDTARDYVFYDFLTDYHERDNSFAEAAKVPSGEGAVAVLDGQQRLTALNIAAYGSLSMRQKNRWRNNSAAYPKRRLYLNFFAEGGDGNDEELGLLYDLQFLTDEQAEAVPGEPDKWFPVGRILDFPDSGSCLLQEVINRGATTPGPIQRGYENLCKLWDAFNRREAINAYLVEDSDPDKVLDIFVRVNSGGTLLSKSDLLLSMATNQWHDLDAREAVRSLVQELNSDGRRQFNFSKDLVLKTALLIAGVDDFRFRVSNFSQGNMARVEQSWPAIRSALIRAAALLHQFGFTGRTLTAASVIIPIAYYLHRRNVSDSYLNSSSDAPDRKIVRRWATRSLLKRGIWGSGLDTLLGALRKVIDENTEAGFPLKAIEHVMAASGKGLSFTEDEIDGLLGLKYGQRETFAVLAMLYPGLDFGDDFHEDHIFPKSLFTATKLRSHGVAESQIGEFKDRVNLLPNLQLLAGTQNEEKQSKLPSAWLEGAFTEEDREAYERENDLLGLPLELPEFLTFFKEREDRMRKRLEDLVGRG